MALLLLLGAIASADARGSRPQNQTSPQTATPTPAAPEPWPRLEVGALLCSSRDDLVRYQTKIADGASAEYARQASNCHPIVKQTGIQILDTDGPSRTQVVTTDEAKLTGWTNTYLPSTPPPSAAKAAGAGK
jgi:hypothetical protein